MKHVTDVGGRRLRERGQGGEAVGSKEPAPRDPGAVLEIMWRQAGLRNRVAVGKTARAEVRGSPHGNDNRFGVAGPARRTLRVPRPGMRRAVSLAALFLAGASVRGQVVDIAMPQDDRWHYPFNFSPGVRPVASCFGAAGDPDFNDRDGAVLVGWDTTSSVAPGMGASAYPIQRLILTVTNEAGAVWPVDLTVDEWTTYVMPGTDTDAGRPIELFGVGFGPTYTAGTWNEFETYVGAAGAGAAARDPYPFTFQAGTGSKLHVEDNVKGLHNTSLIPPVTSFTPTPWAVGKPLNYAPGAQAVPFDIVFEVDLTLMDCAVRRYFQQSLSTGKVWASITTLRETEFMGDPISFPRLLMKEAVGAIPGARAPRLRIVISQGPGDLDGDGFLTLLDAGGFPDCLTGPEGAEGPLCTCGPLDLNDDGTVELRDVAEFQNFLGKVARPD